jgi:hypothetical protein
LKRWGCVALFSVHFIFLRRVVAAKLFLYFQHTLHLSCLAAWALREIGACDFQKKFLPGRFFFQGLWSLATKKSSSENQVFCFALVCQKTKISDFGKPLWQNVQQKTPDELVGSECHDFLFVVISAIAVGEGDFVVINGQKTVIGDGNAVRVSTQVFEHLFGSGKGLFGVDDPVFAKELINKFLEVCF